MVSIENFRAFQFVCAKNAGVNFVAIDVPFQGGGMEDIGEVEVLLACDVGQISFGLVHRLCQTQFLEVFLRRKEGA